MRFVLLDFETRSRADLKKTGAWVYAEHESTEIICLGASFDGAEPVGFEPAAVENFLLGAILCLGRIQNPKGNNQLLLDAIFDPGCIFVAHNVGFEKAIWRHQMKALGWPGIPNNRWHDTMAACARKGLPLKLERAAAALRLPVQKDMEGHRVLMQICKPNKKTGEFDRDPIKIQRTMDYCGVDIGTELGLHRRVRGLGAEERRVWLLDQTINERGVLLDLELVDNMQRIVDDATVPLQKEFAALTGGLATGQRDKVLAWLRTNGANIDNLQKATIDKFLGDEDEVDEDSLAGDDTEDQIALPFSCDRALRIRKILGSASIKKLSAMRHCAGADGRARGLLQYHGAGPGRWAGRLLQPQNFPRPTAKVGKEPARPEDLVAAIQTGDAEYVRLLFGEPIEAVASSLRHTIVAARDHQLLVGDYAKIEAVIVLALAGQRDTAEAVLLAGSAVYTDMAAKIFKRPVKKSELKEYTIGKNTILGCGFQMGHKKFRARYAPDETQEFAQEAVRQYREEFAPMVPKLWRALEDAAVNTVWTKKPHETHGIVYALEEEWLACRLPSGRKLYYYGPRPVRRAMPWDDNDIRPGFTYRAWKTGQWKEIDAYGGLLTENVVQATARDLLVAGMFGAEREGLDVVLTVHDELVLEVPAERADPKVLEAIMCDRPQWAKNYRIPVGADCWAGGRYRK